MKDKLNRHYQLAILTRAIREYFYGEDFLDIITPPIVDNPGIETHIHPFQIYSASKKRLLPKYLHTSPEFEMKRLLSEGHQKIFSLSYCFRDEPNSPIHRPQFLMLEWYRANEVYETLMDDCERLYQHCAKALSQYQIPINQAESRFVRKTVSEIFKEFCDIEILDFLDRDDLLQLIQSHFQDIPLPNQTDTLTWDDLFFLIFLNSIEPKLVKYPFLILYEYPYHLSALSKIKDSDPRVCQRFEVYLHGIELANCFYELTDFEEQKQRSHQSLALKNTLYNYQLPEPKTLFKALDRGIPQTSGIALGIERLLMTLTGKQNLFFD